MSLTVAARLGASILVGPLDTDSHYHLAGESAKRSSRFSEHLSDAPDGQFPPRNALGLLCVAGTTLNPWVKMLNP